MRRPTRAVRRVWLIVVLCSLALEAQTALVPGRATAGRVAGTRYTSFSIALKAGEAVWVGVSQSVDLLLRVVPPAGPHTNFDAFELGPEPATVEASSTGSYRVDVRCVHSCPAQDIVVQVGERHAAGQRDRDRAEAAHLCSQARELAELENTADEAIRTAERAASLFEAIELPAEQASALVIAGVGYHTKGEVAAAERVFRRALELPRPKDPVVDADIMTDIGLCRLNLGDPDDAMDYYRRAEEQWQKLRIRTATEGTTLSNMGILACQLGDCSIAIDYSRRAVAIFERFNQPYDVGQALHNLGTAYENLGDNAAAAEYIGSYVRLLRRTKEKPAALARALTNLALVRVEQRRYAEAVALAKEALPLTNETKRVKPDVLTGLCKASVLVGHPAEAVGFCRDAIALYRSESDERGEATALHNLGTAHAGLGDFTLAKRMFERSLAIRRRMKAPSGLIATLTRLAEAEASLGDLNAALAAADEAASISESVRGRIMDENLRTSYFATKQSSFETYIDVLMRLNGAHPGSGFDVRAFEAAERRRARTLLDMIGEKADELRAGIEPKSGDEDAKLRRRLAYLIRSNAPTRQIDTALREVELGEARARPRNPRISELLNPTPPRAAEIQAQLSANDTLLEYSLGTERSYAWVLTTAGLKSYVLPRREAIEQLARPTNELLAAYRARTANAPSQARFGRLLPQLRRSIYAPVSSGIRGKRLIVVPDGVLQLAPFALIAGVDRELVELPSAWTLVATRNAARGPRGSGIAVFADPVLDPSDPRVPAAVRPRSAAPVKYPRLAFSRDEASAISEAAGSMLRRLAVDFDASKQNFVDALSRGYRYLHASTHATVDAQRPELSSIVLSLVDPKGARIDGQLRLYELYRYRSSADLVTLSACRTAAGKQSDGEGLIGLTRAILFAGAKSVLVTLWPVEDEATAAFMREFYANLLSRHQSPAASLVAAQRRMQFERRWQDPYYWAGFVLHGDWR